MNPRRAAPYLPLIPAAFGLGGAGLALAGLLPAEDLVPLLAGLVVLLAAAALATALLWRRESQRAEEALAESLRATEAEAARRGGQVRGEILSTAAHEVRTPLGGIAGLLDMVLEQPGLPAAARADVLAARQAALDLMVVLRDLIEVPGAVAPPLAAMPFRVDDLMEQVVTLLRARAETRHNRLAMVVATGTPPAWIGDPPRIRQILTNLAANAIRFTEGGDVRIEARENACGALELSVADTGRGIAAERIGSLFDRFQESDGGTGLGLSICRDLAARMGGNIEVHTAPGRGTSFTVALPLRQAREDELGEPDLADPLVATAPRRPGPPVLVVDDVAVNRRLLGRLLDRAGHAHEEATDGATALGLLRSRPYAAVLLDLEMPGMDGLAAIRALRALPGAAGRLPVIAITAHEGADRHRAALKAGMDGTLVKPVTIGDLTRTLDAALRARHVG